MDTGNYGKRPRRALDCAAAFRDSHDATTCPVCVAATWRAHERRVNLTVFLVGAAALAASVWLGWGNG